MRGKIRAKRLRRAEPNCHAAVLAEAQAIRCEGAIFVHRNPIDRQNEAQFISPPISLSSKLAS
ncbi:hypothetical protein J2W22_003658 [Sphingomonas kyeonggiensis]|nr:hypothetical protein [Sphingomonas kyeonggiensis]